MIKLLALLFASVAWGQGMSSNSKAQPSLDEICKLTECRPDTQVTLRTDKGDWSNILPRSPIVLDDMVNLIPNEDLYFSYEIKDNKLVNLKKVKAEAVKALVGTNTFLNIKFEQSKDNSGMILYLKSPLKDKTIKMNMGITPVGKTNFLKTSSCPLRAGLSLYESWPYPIVRIVITNFRLVPPSKESKCEN